MGRKMALAQISQLIRTLNLADACDAKEMLDRQVKHLEVLRFVEIFTQKDNKITCTAFHHDGSGDRHMRVLNDHDDYLQFVSLTFQVEDLQIKILMERHTERDTGLSQDEVDITVTHGGQKTHDSYCCRWIFPDRDETEEEEEGTMEEIEEKFGKYFESVHMCMQLIAENSHRLPFEDL
jgi:hypothetical protein